MAIVKTLYKYEGFWEDVSRVEISVVLESLQRYERKPNPQEQVTHQCLTLLLKHIVKHGDKLSLETSKLAKTYGISLIIIRKCYLKDDSESMGPVLISHKTKLFITSVLSYNFFKLKSTTIATKLAGLEKERKKLTQLMTLSKFRHISSSQSPVGVLLHGPPGCGKTSLARSFAHSSDAVYLGVESTDLLQTKFGSGAEELRRIFRKAQELSNEGCVVLFLDEIETLCPGHNNTSLGNRQITNALASELDRITRMKISRLLIVATTNSIASVHKSLRRPGRFDSEVLISVPSLDQRVAILECATGTMCLETGVSLCELAKKTPGFVGADLKALCEEAFSYASKRLQVVGCAEEERCSIKMSDFNHALHSVVPSLKKSLSCQVDVQPVKWEDIGGLENIKDEIKQSIEWPLLYPESLKRLDIAATKGVLLYGPPGCCKTTMVRAAATSSNVTFLSLNGAQVYSPFVGESERIISEAFQKARALAPSILFLDEIDSLVGKRSSSNGNQSRVQERILTTLLNEMDGVGIRLDDRSVSEESSVPSDQRMKLQDETMSSDCAASLPDESNLKTSMNNVIVIGATNRPDMIDAALLRPGRLDRHIYVPLPDFEGRRSILQILTNKMATNPLDLESLCGKTEFFSGADISNLCREAGLLAVRETMTKENFNFEKLEVTQKHFEAALSAIRPSLSSEHIHFYAKQRNKLR